MTHEYKERNEQVKNDFVAGFRPSYIAQKYNISRQRVYQICEGIKVLVIPAPVAPAAEENPEVTE